MNGDIRLSRMIRLVMPFSRTCVAPGSKGEDITDLFDRLKLLSREKRQWRFVGQLLMRVIQHLPVYPIYIQYLYIYNFAAWY